MVLNADRANRCRDAFYQQVTGSIPFQIRRLVLALADNLLKGRTVSEAGGVVSHQRIKSILGTSGLAGDVFTAADISCGYAIGLAQFG